MFNSYFVLRIQNISKLHFKEYAASISRVYDQIASSFGAYQTTWWHIPENSHGNQNFKFLTGLTTADSDGLMSKQ
jgi:hypothetical protein